LETVEFDVIVLQPGLRLYWEVEISFTSLLSESIDEQPMASFAGRQMVRDGRQFSLG
jgi:hypothetical protein